MSDVFSNEHLQSKIRELESEKTTLVSENSKLRNALDEAQEVAQFKIDGAFIDVTIAEDLDKCSVRAMDYPALEEYLASKVTP